MYGMVNKALQEMIVSRFGVAAWERIRTESGVDIEVFITNNAYPDEVTYNLVFAASKVLDIPASEVLHDFGRHWVLKTAQDGYGELLRTGGKDLAEFLRNLPALHTRVTLIFPHLRPPRFRSTDSGANSLRLHYYSHRAGLAPFVVGLLDGLGEMFNTPVKTTLEAAGEGSDHETFLVEWESPLA